MLIGPTFGQELAAAGYKDGISWNPINGTILFDAAMTQPQRDAVMAVYTAHDPATPPTPTPKAVAKATMQASIATATQGTSGLPEIRQALADIEAYLGLTP